MGCSPWGCEESDTTEWLPFHFSLSCIGEGNGSPLQCSCLENPRDGGAWWAAIYGVSQSRTRLKWLSSSSNLKDLALPQCSKIGYKRVMTFWLMIQSLALVSLQLTTTMPSSSLTFSYMHKKCRSNMGTTSLARFSSVSQLCLTLCNPTDCSMPGLPVHHQLQEFTQTHVRWVGDAIQPSHPLSFPSPPAFYLFKWVSQMSQMKQGLFKWVSSLHQVAKVSEFQLQHQSFQWIFRGDFL